MFHYYVFVCILPEKTIPKIIYTLSGGTLNPTQSFTTVTPPSCLLAILLLPLSYGW